MMFIDVSGSTALYESIGDQQALARVERCLSILSRIAEEFSGRVVKSMGDGLMCAFGSAEAAIQAGRVMHERIVTQEAAGGSPLGIHIGCHFGPVIESAGDVFGDSVNVAARVAGLAKVGQILTTEETVSQLPAALRESTRRLDQMPVKGKSAPVMIYEVLWQVTDELTMLGTRYGGERAVGLRLSHQGRECRMDNAGPGALTLGRDSGCDIVVVHSRASRYHARIERRRDKFVLADQSSNGTWVWIAGEQEVVLKREELMLRSHGRIALGHRTSDSGAVLVEFVCE
ncbi:MAG: adenylate/guanylate cyclase domain-containing protein [Betaproteobacteria bacterium]|nr:adenylate/guanylate cyclase domain-containing protein [Betaproteobacteria bacterium]